MSAQTRFFGSSRTNLVQITYAVCLFVPRPNEVDLLILRAEKLRHRLRGSEGRGLAALCTGFTLLIGVDKTCLTNRVHEPEDRDKETVVQMRHCQTGFLYSWVTRLMLPRRKEVTIFTHLMDRPFEFATHFASV